jgi:hypothetical protein
VYPLGSYMASILGVSPIGHQSFKRETRRCPGWRRVFRSTVPYSPRVTNFGFRTLCASSFSSSERQFEIPERRNPTFRRDLKEGKECQIVQNKSIERKRTFGPRTESICLVNCVHEPQSMSDAGNVAQSEDDKLWD